MVGDLAAALRAEARQSNERRAIVVHGHRESTIETVQDIFTAADIPAEEAVHVGQQQSLACERVPPQNADQLLGTTRTAVVLDWHDTCLPNALGQLVGVVDGGGLFIVVAPPLQDWVDQTDAFHESLATPPAAPDTVGHRYHHRVLELIGAHRGIAIVDADTPNIDVDGRTNPAPRRPTPIQEPPTDREYPREAYRACQTTDQVTALHTLETLRTPGNAVVLEADRGRGKSSVAGLAAACLAADGDDVLVTAPHRRGVSPLFDRVRDLVPTIDSITDATEMDIRTRAGGRVWFQPPDTIDDLGAVDVLFVDEAAGLPVAELDAFLACNRVAFITTVHGYEGTGRGFTVRFRGHLTDSHHTVTESTLTTPIRYAGGDPVEVWAFHTLLLDASPAVDPVVDAATPASVEFDFIDQATLASDDRLLGECFGLLVTAHYQTEPNDLARLLDAPNITVAALTHDDHVVTVALLAAEGGLDDVTRDQMYDGSRIRGNLLPDVFASQLRDPDAAAPRGWRVLRIATHPVARSRGLGSRLLAEITAAAETREYDWVGVAYGATPDLVSFWAENGFSPVHFSTTRSAESGEYSALMLNPLSPAGEAVHDRLSHWFCARMQAVLGDTLRDVDPDVIRAVLNATRGSWTPQLSERDWRVVAGAAYGPGQYAVDPRPFRALAVAYFTSDQDGLSPRQERLLVLQVLQAHAPTDVADELGFHSSGECLRALGDAYATLCSIFGGEVADDIRDRYR